jgi:hypothetical protein
MQQVGYTTHLYEARSALPADPYRCTYWAKIAAGENYMARSSTPAIPDHPSPVPNRALC